MSQRIAIQNVGRAVSVQVQVREEMGVCDLKVRRNNREQREMARRVKLMARLAKGEEGAWR